MVETKFDGYRLMARIDGGKARLITRNGHDWTAKMPALARAVEALGLDASWLDGEIVVMNSKGVPDFNALQNAIDSVAGDAIDYFVFDLPFHRRPRPAEAAAAGAAHFAARDRRGPSVRPHPLQPELCGHSGADARGGAADGPRGHHAQAGDAPYVSGRTETWLKLKSQARQELVICGFTDRANAHGEVGSLLLGYHEGGVLKYAGNVGTGWNARTGRDLHARLVKLEVAEPLFDAEAIRPGRWSRRTSGGERWVEPKLVAEVSFAEWTPDDHVRQAVFQGLRLDTPASSVRRERAGTWRGGAGRAGGTRPAGAKGPAPATSAGSIKVTNPERVIDPSTGLTKLALVRYYESVAERILPHLIDRPVSLVRAPEGITGELFFQKHPETRMPGLRVLDKALWPGHAALLAVDTADALVSAAQMNSVEFHTWNSTARKIDQPDRVVFDLDPGEGVSWAHVQEAAVLVRALLQELKLESWLKTSGGKGLHVVVPLAPSSATTR